MFILIDNDTKVQTCFAAIKKDAINCILVLELVDGKREKYQFRSEHKMNEKIKSIASQTYLELNLDIVKLSNITSVTETDDGSVHNIIYMLESGTKVVESFDCIKNRDKKYNSLLTLGINNSDYNSLWNKPSINGVELVGDVSVSDLGIKTSEIINDSNYVKKDTSELTNYYVKDSTYNRNEIDEIVKRGSGIPIISGTEANPLIASDIKFGVYVISGIVQSTPVSFENVNIKMGIYSVWQEDNRTIFWEERKGNSPQTYVIFSHDYGVDPVVDQVSCDFEEFVENYVSNALIDGGEIE